ncbi:MAG TPA: hypothetical protein DCE41_15415 [Cytophagales bacterium]|nr:hypothetical protein [Cytophagales bacterium]HAA20655.1 hypothetical protein [Cytophagales bacterium]HAP59376.1 hypothetical protein [Cytophagales bacterium]
MDTPHRKLTVFLASSEEMISERDDLELKIGRKNSSLVDLQQYIELVRWEHEAAFFSVRGTQDTYNQKVAKADLFILLAWGKVGVYTESEFDTALDHFAQKGSPKILTFFKQPEPPGSKQNQATLQSLWAFQQRLEDLGHFYDRFHNSDELWLKIEGKIDALLQQDKASPKRGTWKYITGLALVIGILSGIAGFSGWNIRDLLHASAPEENTEKPPGSVADINSDDEQSDADRLETETATALKTPTYHLHQSSLYPDLQQALIQTLGGWEISQQSTNGIQISHTYQLIEKDDGLFEARGGKVAVHINGNPCTVDPPIPLLRTIPEGKSKPAVEEECNRKLRAAIQLHANPLAQQISLCLHGS